jgi:hypothetical protein
MLRTLRVILLASLIFGLAGSAFAGGQNGNSQGGGSGYQGGNSQGGGSGYQGGKGGSYLAPELDFKGPLKYELLVIAGGAVLLLERRRRRRRALSNK